MTTNSSGDFSLSKFTNITGVCKSTVKVISKILNCNLTEVAILAILWSKVLYFFDVVQSYLFLFRLEEENLQR